LDEGIQEGGATGTLEAAREEPVRPTNRDRTELILGTVVIDPEPPSSTKRWSATH
jgi:hypothetical protein